jgi:hypothetical protein
MEDGASGLAADHDGLAPCPEQLRHDRDLFEDHALGLAEVLRDLPRPEALDDVHRHELPAARASQEAGPAQRPVGPDREVRGDENPH